MTTLPSRNASCPCGSGKRFKHCHGAEMAETSPLDGVPATGSTDVFALLSEGLALQQSGRPAEAAQRYQRVLHQQPENPDAWHLLGLLDLAQGKAATALEKIERAIAVYPEHPQFFSSRIRAEIALDRMKIAQQHAREYAQRWPSDAQSSVLLGLAGRVCDPKTAEEHLRRALALGQEQPEVFFELTQALLDRGEPEQATAVLARGLDRYPDNPLLLNQLGIAHSRLGSDDLAERAWVAALQSDPHSWEARANYGEFLAKARRGRNALAVLLPTIPECAGYAQYWLSLALAYTEVGDTAAALVAFREVQMRQPDSAIVNLQLGHACLEANRLDEAKGFVARAIRLGENAARGEMLLFEIAKKQCDYREYRRLAKELPRWLAEIETLRPPSHWFMSAPVSAAEQKRIAEAYSSVVTSAAHDSLRRTTRLSAERIRLGYVTSAIRNHPTPSLITEVWERHDRARFEVFVYSSSPDEDSDYRRRIKSAIEHFVDCGDFTDDQICRRVDEDAIDLLVDLDGYIQYARTRVFSQRLAPVQVNYLGYPGTLGSSRYDYIVTDRMVTPPEMQEYFSERFLYLPHCYLPSDTRRRPSVACPARAEHALPEGAFVYCCFNGLYKLTPEMFQRWMDILRSTEGSVLWLLAGEPAAIANLQREALDQDVDPKRLIFAPPQRPREHLSRYPLADLFLDTLPCNAHTTCNDALLMGLPVLTCRGETFAGRVAASQLTAAGLPGLVAANFEEYQELAIRLAHSREHLAAHRAHLAKSGLESPLFDMAAYTGALEEQFARIHAECSA